MRDKILFFISMKITLKLFTEDPFFKVMYLTKGYDGIISFAKEITDSILSKMQKESYSNEEIKLMVDNTIKSEKLK